MLIRARVSFRLESELAEPITAWLERAGFTVRLEVPILGRRADLLGLRPRMLTAIEAKMNNWAQALRQAIAYQLGADQSWVAMPLAAASRAYRQRWYFEAERVGLLAIDDRGGVRSAIPAGPSPRLLPFLRDKILETGGLENPMSTSEWGLLEHTHSVVHDPNESGGPERIRTQTSGSAFRTIRHKSGDPQFLR